MRVLSSLTENLSLKLVSLAVSVMLFLFVSVESATPVDVDFRVEYRTADDIMIVGEAPSVVHATLRGPWATFRRYDPNELKPIIIDLSDGGPGTVRHQVDTADIIAPGGMTVVAVRPSELQLLLDRKTERRVPVQVDLVGRPAFGYELESVTPKPRELRVIGPAREMQSLDFVFTRPVDVEGRQADFTAEVDAKAPPPPLRLKDKKVAVAVRVVEEMVTRSFDDLAVSVDNAPAGTRAEPERVSVVLKGPRSIVDTLDPKTLVPYVDAQPELDGGVPVFQKAADLRGRPDRAQWIGTAPTIQVTVPKNKLPKTKRK